MYLNEYIFNAEFKFGDKKLNFEKVEKKKTEKFDCTLKHQCEEVKDDFCRDIQSDIHLKDFPCTLLWKIHKPVTSQDMEK